MRIVAAPGALACGVFPLLLASLAHAADVDARSTTFVGASPVVLGGRVRSVIPFTELVGLSVRNIGTSLADDVSISLDGWATAELGGERVLGGDLGVAFIDGRFLSRRLRVRLGRQSIVGGAARFLYLDGLLAEGRLPGGFGLTAYAGQPVARAFSNYGVGDFAMGARASWAPSIHSEVGASFIQAYARSHLARQDVGLDGRVRPHRVLTLTGSATFSLADMRLAELDVGPRWQPLEDLEVRAVYRRTAPDLFLPRNSIFTVFADTSRDEAGGALYYQATKRLGLSADGRALFVQGDPGYDASVSALYRPFRRPDTSMTLTLRRLSIPFNAFTQARLGARHRLVNGVGLSLDLDVYSLDKPINAQTLSFSGGGTVSWAFSRSWLLAATLWSSVTPTFESRFEAVAKLVYTFDSARN